MKKSKQVRVAHVRFSSTGKAYPTRCDREDIREGNEVEVLMRANSDASYYMEGIIDTISYHRWHCTCHVVNLISEVEYSITDDGMFDRKVNLPAAPVYSIADWKERKKGYNEGLSPDVRSEMRDIYEAVAGNDGENAYLSDGVWITPDGSLDDRGR